MNRVEFVKWKLEENTKKYQELKEQYEQKEKEYLSAKNDFEKPCINSEIEIKKNLLIILKENHKKELSDLMERHKKEINEAKLNYYNLKDNRDTNLKKLKSELTEISIKLRDSKIENHQLHKENKKIKYLENIGITKHAIVQYLNRYKGMDIDKIREDIKFKTNSKKIEDHIVVEHLVADGIINLEEIEREILPEDVKKLITADELLGSSGTFELKSGFRIAVSDGSVVTFLPKKEKSKKIFVSKKEKRKLKKMRL